MQHFRERFRCFYYARARHHVNIRRDREDAMVASPRPVLGFGPDESDHAALVLFGDADGIRHVAHVDDDVGIARHDFFGARRRDKRPWRRGNTFSPPAISITSFR